MLMLLVVSVVSIPAYLQIVYNGNWYEMNGLPTLFFSDESNL